MKYQNKYRIDSTRLKHWDYSNPANWDADRNIIDENKSFIKTVKDIN